MKKKIIALFSLVLCLMLSISLVACNKNKHEAKTEWKSDATNHWHECATKDHTDKLDEAPHTWDEGKVTDDPTEAAEGVRTFTCTVCKATKTAPIGKLEHKHTYATEWSKDENNHWHAATCAHTDEKNDLQAHTFGEWTTKTPADYGVDKVEERTCTVCGERQEQTVENSAIPPKDNDVPVDTIEFTYNGKSQPIDSLVKAENKANMVIKYVGVGETTYEESTTAPTNAGTYQYTITIPATAEWKAAEKTGNYTIEKYELTELYKKQTAEYNGKDKIWIRFYTLDNNKPVNIGIVMESANVGAKFSYVWLPELLQDNYTFDEKQVEAEIVAKKLSKLYFEIDQDNVDTMTDEQTIEREIAGVNNEKIVVVITFNPGELIEEEGLELSFDGKGGAVCIIRFETENPNYELDLTGGELKLVKSTAA